MDSLFKQGSVASIGGRVVGVVGMDAVRVLIRPKVAAATRVSALIPAAIFVMAWVAWLMTNAPGAS